MVNAVEDEKIRKAIAVYYLDSILKGSHKGQQEKIAATLNRSSSLISRWTNHKDSLIPSVKHLEQISDYTGYSIDQMIQVAVTADDDYGILKDSTTARDYRIRNNISPERTHDDSPEHIRNLRCFSGGEFDLIYLRDGMQERFIIDTIPEPKKSGFIELRLPKGKDKTVVYSGTLIAPPELNRAFVFLEQKNSNGIYKDRGMVILFFPQEKAKAQNYKCGVGLMMSLDRDDERKHTLIQRVVLIPRRIRIMPRAKTFIDSYLHLPIVGDSVLSVTDLRKNQQKLYRKLFPDKNIADDTSDEAEL